MRHASNALKAAQRRLDELPAHVHSDDPRAALSRVLAGAEMARGFAAIRGDCTYDHAVHLAALSVALVAAIDRAEAVRIETGEAA